MPRPATLRLRCLLAVLVRPHLWLTALGAARRLAARHWWAHPPFLPLPDGDYLRFRTLTAVGGDGNSPSEVDDVLAWLRWRRRWPKMAAKP